jgi:hypothetical protein
MTLTWVRDHYDLDKNRYIGDAEKGVAHDDWLVDTITTAELQEVIAACDSHTLLPAYDIPITQFNIQTGAKLKVDGVEVI